MTNTTNIFTQNWKASATDESNGYMDNWHHINPATPIRLLHIGLTNLPRAAHVRLFITTWNSEKVNLFDDDVQVGHSACWDGSMILRNVTSIGAQHYGFLENDKSYLRIIWEEIRE